MRFSAFPLIVSFCLLSGCATSPHYRTVDHFFAADHVPKAALNDIAGDIRDHSDGSVIVLVKYRLEETSLAGSEKLARVQGKTVRDYLRSQGVKAPFQILSSPANLTVNQIWVTYQVRLDGKKKSSSATKERNKKAPDLKPEILSI